MAALVARNGAAEDANLLRLRGTRALSPPSSGAGRLFEAAAALAGLCDRNSFEGEAAVRLEAAADDVPGGTLAGWSIGPTRTGT